MARVSLLQHNTNNCVVSIKSKDPIPGLYFFNNLQYGLVLGKQKYLITKNPRHVSGFPVILSIYSCHPGCVYFMDNNARRSI